MDTQTVKHTDDTTGALGGGVSLGPSDFPELKGLNDIIADDAKNVNGPYEISWTEYSDSRIHFPADHYRLMAQVAPRTVNPDLYPIAVLIDELRHDEVQTRVNAVQQLEHIALALGPTRTRNELIPFLVESSEENDAVLGATAEKLGFMVDAVGGPEFASSLLRPLEDLLMLEEASIRDKALESLRTVIARMPTRHVEEHCSQLIFRLAANDWFAARISACTLLPDVAQRAFSDELLRAFVELCGDDVPMVRRAAITAIAVLAKETPTGRQRDLLDALRRLARDDQDSVRIVTIPTTMALAREVFPNAQDCYNALFPEIRSCIDDPSWRVRVTVADAMEQVIAHTPAKYHQQVYDMYVKLLADPEAEVRAVAVSQMAQVCASKPDRALINILLPSLNKLIKDDAEIVRSALSEAIAKMCPVFGAALTSDSLVQFVLKLLRDPSTAVRLKLIANLHHITPALKVEDLSPCVLPAVLELATDRQWRVRISILEHTPLLAHSLGQRVFVDELLPVALRWLCDPVFKVREAASVNVAKLATELGAELSAELITPHIAELGKNSNYLYRLTALMCVAHMTAISGGEALLPIVTAMVTDSVPNVRFNVAKTLQHLYSRVSRKVAMDTIIPALRQLTTDTDKDVKFFAKAAIVAIDSS